jgi:hypothetical protein
MERKHYQITDRAFYQDELVWGQVRWLYARLKGYDLQALGMDQVFALLAEQLPAILAILLIEEGQTQAEKVQAGEAKMRELEAWLEANLHPQEALPVIRDFFVLSRPGELLAGFRTMDSPQETGSLTPSSS